MNWAKGKSEYYWFRGRYYISRSLAFDRNPLGHWIFIASFKSSTDAAPILICPERRDSFEEAERDCIAHYRALSGEEGKEPPSDPQTTEIAPPYPSQRLESAA